MSAQIEVTGDKKKGSEWVFAVDNEEERDEWLDSIKMVMLQEHGLTSST